MNRIIVSFGRLELAEVAAAASFLTLSVAEKQGALTHDEWLALDTSFDTVVRDVSDWAPIVEAVWYGLTFNTERHPDGVWLYDVVAPFGRWLVQHRLDGRPVSEELALATLAALVGQFFGIFGLAIETVRGHKVVIKWLEG